LVRIPPRPLAARIHRRPRRGVDGARPPPVTDAQGATHSRSSRSSGSRFRLARVTDLTRAMIAAKTGAFTTTARRSNPPAARCCTTWRATAPSRAGVPSRSSSRGSNFLTPGQDHPPEAAGARARPRPSRTHVQQDQILELYLNKAYFARPLRSLKPRRSLFRQARVRPRRSRSGADCGPREIALRYARSVHATLRSRGARRCST